MTALTLHAIDDILAKRLQRSARLEGKSMNLFAKELLASALGLTAPRRPRVRNDLARFCGTLSDEDAADIKQTLKDFDRIDEESRVCLGNRFGNPDARSPFFADSDVAGRAGVT